MVTQTELAQGAERVIPLLFADFILMCVSANTENSEQLQSHNLIVTAVSDYTYTN